MRILTLAVWLSLIALPAQAQTISANDARSHLGQSVTVEGTVSEVHLDNRSGVTFIDIDGNYPREAFTGVIFEEAAATFPNVNSLVGKLVDITGKVQVYKGRVEIILMDSAQLRAK
jgi:DNA/RNA endonuclease YhcR with UshA esterase domain